MAITFTTGETFPAGASVVTATKLNNIVNAMTMTMATSKVLGRTTASTGAVEELSITGTGNVVLSTSPTLVTPALGTPSAIVLTNASGTASININGTVGATTPNTGAFTTLSATGNTTVGAGGTGTTAVNIAVNGGSGSAGGAYLDFKRNSVSQCVIGTESAVIGNTSNALAVYGGSNDVKFWAGGAGNTMNLSSTGLALTLPFAGSDTTDASSSTTGALKTAGGLGVAKKLYVGTDLTVGGGTYLYGTYVRSAGGVTAISLTSGGAGGSGNIGLYDNSAVLTTVLSYSGVYTSTIDAWSGGVTTFGSRLVTLASSTSKAGLNAPHGTAPTSPTDGDIWTTTSGLFVRINGVTRQVTVT